MRWRRGRNSGSWRRTGPGGWEPAANHLLSSMHDALQSVFVPVCGAGEPHGDGGGEDGLDDGRVELHQHLGRHLEFPQLLKEVHPLLGRLDKGADGRLPLEVLGDGGAQETEGVHNGDGGGGVHQGEGRRWGCDSPEVHDHLHCLLGVQLQVVVAAPGSQPVHLSPVGGLIVDSK